MMFGRELTLPVDILIPKPAVESSESKTEYVQKLRETLENVYDHARTNLKRASQHQKKDYDTRVKIHPYKPGDLVYRRNHKLKKFEPVWNGPLVVVKVLDNHLYRCAGRRRSYLLHHDLLAPYLPSSTTVPNWTKAIQCSINKLK